MTQKVGIKLQYLIWWGGGKFWWKRISQRRTNNSDDKNDIIFQTKELSGLLQSAYGLPGSLLAVVMR